MTPKPTPKQIYDFRLLMDRLNRNYDIGFTMSIKRAFRKDESEIRDSFNGRYFDLQLIDADGKGLTLAEAARVLELAANHIREQIARPHPFGLLDKPFTDDGNPNFIKTVPLRLKHQLPFQVNDTE